MGSGSTAVAAINTGRRFIGIERDKKYFGIACERIKEANAECPIE
jgi:DNA modification methylase